MPTTISGTDGVSAVVDGTIVAADIASGAVTQAKLASNVTTTGPAFRAYANSTTSVNNGVTTKINLGFEDYDTANCFASSRFTPNVAGYYWISAAVRSENINAGQAIISKNGTLHSMGSQCEAGTWQSTVSDLVYLNGTTDYVELFYYHAAGSARTVATQSGISPIAAFTYMSGFLARAA